MAKKKKQRPPQAAASSQPATARASVQPGLAGFVTGWPESATARLSAVASDAVWRDVVAFVSALVTATAVGSDLIVHFTQIQLAIVVAIAAGLCASRGWTGATAAGLGALVASWAEPPWYVDQASSAVAGIALATALGAAAGGWLVFSARKRWGPTATKVLVGVAVLVLVVNLWTTSVLIVNQGDPSVVQLLDGTPPANIKLSDDIFYVRVHALLKAGGPFYQTFATAIKENPVWGITPPDVLAFRLPTFFWFWNLLPASHWILYAMLVLGTLLVAGEVLLCATVARLELAIPGAAALCSLLLFWTGDTFVLYTEAWAGCLTALAIVAFVVWARRGAESAFWAGLGFVTLAAMLRELTGYLPFAGAAVTALWREKGWKRRIVGWGAVCVFVIAVYAAHWNTASRYIDTSVKRGFTHGGWANLVAGVTEGTLHMGFKVGLPYVLVVLGLIGAACLPRRETRAFALAATLAPLALFMVAGNGALATETNRMVNYWGGIVVPVLVTLAPVAFAILPGFSAEDARSRTGATGGQSHG
jgi:hypothetical protein